MRRWGWTGLVIALGACGPRGATAPPADATADAGAVAEADGAGRLVVLADFDRVRTAEVRADKPAAPRVVTVDVPFARRRSGAAALACDVSARHAVHLAAGPSWPRDWTRFTSLSLLLHLSAPRHVQLEIRSGLDRPYRYQAAPLPLAAGWNAVQLDLDDAHPYIDRANVLGLSLRAIASDEPVTLALDDLLLVDARRDLLASPDASAGTLYVRQVGRRLVVGCAGRYEVVFAGGQIVGCFDLERDRQRLASLCLNGPLGPVRLAVDPAALRAGAELDVAFDASVVAGSQRLVEANPLRVVVQTEPRPTAPPAPPASTAAAGAERGATTRYVFDAHGRVRITVENAAREADGSAAQAWAVLFDAAEGGRWDFDLVCPPDRAGRFARATARSGRDAVSRLVWILPAYQGRVVLRSLRSPASSLRAAVFLDTAASGGAAHRSILLLPPATGEPPPGQVAWFADDVVPARLPEELRGRYDAVDGCYEVTPARGRAWFTLGDDGVRRRGVLVRVRDTRGRRVTATCNGAVLTTAARPVDGDVRVELPDVAGPTAVEIHVR